MRRSLSTWPGLVLATTLSVLLALTALVQTGPVLPAAAHQANEVQVRVVDFAFEPATLTVPVGTTVVWTNDGQRPHTITADDGAFDSGRLDPGEQFSQTFEEPGTYTYHCGFHPEMQATIVVTEEEPDSIEVATAEADETPPAEPTPASEETTTESTAGPGRNLEPALPSRLAHVHAGTCDELGIVVYSLPDLRTYRLNEGESGVGAIELISGTANVPLDNLFGEPFSIHIHESSQNKQTYIACADVGGRPDAPWSAVDGLTLEAQEQNGSGYRGFATLRPTAEDKTTVTVFLAASPDAVEAVESQEPPEPGASYTSPTYGYTIGYGPMWQESENRSVNGRDRFVLFNGTSFITFTGAAEFGGDPQACVDAFVEQLTADPAVSNLALAERGSTEATGAFATYTHDYTFPGRVEPYTLFVGCIPLVENEAVLAVVQNVPTADYDEQVELREALLRGLTLNQ